MAQIRRGDLSNEKLIMVTQNVFGLAVTKLWCPVEKWPCRTRRLQQSLLGVPLSG